MYFLDNLSILQYHDKPLAKAQGMARKEWLESAILWIAA